MPDAATAIALRQRPRLLVVRPDHLGDVLFVGPALRLLRDSLPDASITLLVGPWSQPVAERLPGGAVTHTLNFPYYNRRTEAAWRRYSRLVVASFHLRRLGPFTAAMVLRDDDWAGAWLCRLAGIPRVVAHQHPLVDIFADLVLAADRRPTHVAAANLALAAAAIDVDIGTGDRAPTGVTRANDFRQSHGGDHDAWHRHPLAFRLTEDDHARAVALLATHGVTNDARPLAIHPGAGGEVKRWPAPAWAEAVAQLARPGEPVILTGSRAEAPLTTSVAEAMEATSTPAHCVNLAGETDLCTLGAVLARCRLVMGPDSGPLHLATAVGTPSVHLYGPADPARFGPWGPPERHCTVMSPMGCAPCGRLDWRNVADHPCTAAISVEAVVMAARSVMGEGL